MNKTILAVSAHPDDAEFGCGGTLFKFREKGYEIFLVVATNGENGFKISHKPTNQRIRVRHKEQLNAAAYLGIKKVFFLNYRDCYLKNDHSLRDRIAIIIKKVKPEIVFSFDPGFHAFENINLNHRDHRVIAEAAFDAAFAARNRYVVKGEPHAIQYFYFYASENPNHYENITQYIDKKIAISKMHRSQYSDEKVFEKWMKANLCKYTKKFKYSEQFRIVEVVPQHTIRPKNK